MSTSAPELPAGLPAGLVLTSTCECGSQVTATPLGDEWTYVDEAGASRTPRPHVRALPWWDGAWGIDWEAMARDDIAAYADLAFYRTSGTGVGVHNHRGNVTGFGQVPTGPDGWPMRLSPTGWVTRYPRLLDVSTGARSGRATRTRRQRGA